MCLEERRKNGRVTGSGVWVGVYEGKRKAQVDVS
jgi:hypothetical protein